MLVISRNVVLGAPAIEVKGAKIKRFSGGAQRCFNLA
jgi:hypothetical protein